MNSSLRLSLATLLLLSTFSCDKSRSPPTSQKTESLVSQPNAMSFTKGETVPCYKNINDRRFYDFLDFNEQRVLYSHSQDKNEPLIVHGYLSSEGKVSSSGTPYFEVSIIQNMNARSEIENRLRKERYTGKISFWPGEQSLFPSRP